MNKLADGNLFDENGHAIALSALPVSFYSPLDSLFNEYDGLKEQMLFIADKANKENRAFSHFMHGNGNHGLASFNVKSVFNIEGGLRSLDATFWSSAISLTKTMDVFSAQKRNEWNEMINKMKTPPFEKKVVIDTLVDLMHNRDQFFSEKVEGVFRNLSRHHKTNSRMGFTERMIIEYCISSYDYLSHDQMNYVSDLRACISILRNEGNIASYMTYQDVQNIMHAGNYGKWHDFDGGAFRLRIYKKGTVHVEIHPDISWKLNKVLAALHPTAIASEHIEAPKKKFKEFALHNDVMPMDLRHALNDLIRVHYRAGSDDSLCIFNLSDHKTKPDVRQKVESVLSYMGGIDKQGIWHFDYNVRNVLIELVRTGVMPEQVSYQYYPTPEGLSALVNDLAEVDDHHSVLEPSAGMGNLVDGLYDKARITCVEISKQHCLVLKEKGFGDVIEGDFLAQENLGLFDRVLLNPPFSEGRAEAHLIKAFEHVKAGGVLVAVLPGSMHNKNGLLGSAECTFQRVDDAGFEGTKVCVTVLKAIKVS